MVKGECRQGCHVAVCTIDEWSVIGVLDAIQFDCVLRFGSNCMVSIVRTEIQLSQVVI